MSLIDNAVTRARADAATTPSDDKLGQVLAGIGGLATRMDADEKRREDSQKEMMTMMDSLSKRMDACEADTKARKDADEEKARKGAASAEEEKTRKDAEDKKAEDEKARKDAEEKEAKEEKARSDAAANNPDVAAQIKALERRIPVELSDADRAKFVAAQVKCERVAQAFGDSDGAPRWLNGESLPDYQRRLMSRYKQHSTAWKDKDLARVDASVLDVAETQIYADAETAASAPSSVVAGTLRELVTQDRTGRRITRFHGDTSVTWAPFKQPRRGVTGMRTDFRSAS